MIRTFLAIFILAVSAIAQTAGVPGQPKPVKADQVAGNDGTTLRALKTDANGQLIVTAPTGASSNQVQGTAASGAAPVGNPVPEAGYDPGGNVVRTIQVDGAGRQVTTVAVADADGTPNNPSADVVGNLGPNGPTRVTVLGYNGASKDRLRTQSVANSANAFQAGVQQADFPGQWAVINAPAAATAATISKAAVASTKHVAKSITVCISAVAAQPNIVFNLRDGATGAGTVVWTALLSAAAGTSQCQSATFTIIGSTNTAMTLESSTAPAATNFATVSVSGYDIQ
jgi:hypothetical protein